MSSRPPIPSGLNDLQIDDLQFFLDEVENSMNMEVIDGFFCALICGPASVPRDEYLPLVFGGTIPAFSNPADREEIFGLLDIHWATIDSTLGKNQTYYPFFYADMEGKVTANDWVHGFMRGIDMRREAWTSLMNEGDELLKPILALHAEYVERQKPDAEPNIPANERENLVKQLIANLSALYQRYRKTKDGGAAGSVH